MDRTRWPISTAAAIEAIKVRIMVLEYRSEQSVTKF